MNINGVPDKISRAALVAMIESLGLDPNQLRYLEIGFWAVTAVVTVRGPDGKPLNDPVERHGLATHTITIPVVDS